MTRIPVPVLRQLAGRWPGCAWTIGLAWVADDDGSFGTAAPGDTPQQALTRYAAMIAPAPRRERRTPRRRPRRWSRL